MQSLTLHSHLDEKGILLLKVPFTPNDANLEVKVTIQAVTFQPKTPEELGYPPGFFGEVIGGWVGEPLVRAEQEEFEQKEKIK